MKEHGQTRLLWRMRKVCAFLLVCALILTGMPLQSQRAKAAGKCLYWLGKAELGATWDDTPVQVNTDRGNLEVQSVSWGNMELIFDVNLEGFENPQILVDASKYWGDDDEAAFAVFAGEDMENVVAGSMGLTTGDTVSLDATEITGSLPKAATSCAIIAPGRAVTGILIYEAGESPEYPSESTKEPIEGPLIPTSASAIEAPTMAPPTIPTTAPAIEIPTMDPSTLVSEAPTMEAPTPEASTTPPVDQDQAFLMFTDSSWNWGNWNTKVNGGYGNDALITGDGDYSVSIDAEGFQEYQENAGNKDFELSEADGACVLLVSIQNLCNSPNLDISDMVVSNVRIYADGEEVSHDNSKILMGNIEGNGNFFIEIYNSFGKTEDDPSIDLQSLAFKESLSVSFTLSGIKEGTSQGAFNCDTDGDGYNDTYWKVKEAWDDGPLKTMAPPTQMPVATATALPERNEDQDQAFLMFTDGSWSWGNWDTKVNGGYGNDALITGDGDYSVSIDAEGWQEYNEGTKNFELSEADGAIVLMVDFQNLCNSPNLDISAMEVSNVRVYADNKLVSLNNSKIAMGDIEGRGNFRIEICNMYSVTADDPSIDMESLTFKESLSVSFTLSGIKKGTSQGAFNCDADGDGESDTYWKVKDAKDEWIQGDIVADETQEPTLAPTKGPTASPTVEPEKTVEPTLAPTKGPTASPTVEPEETEEAREPEETVEPVITPTPEETASPTEPIVEPTASPAVIISNTPVPTVNVHAEDDDSEEEEEEEEDEEEQEVSGGSFIITSSKSKEVEYQAPVKKNSTKITVSDTVKVVVNGKEVTCKVTSISKGAFSECKKLKEVSLGKNITKIENGAFKGCSKLKTLTIKSKSLKDVGKNAFKDINRNCTIKVPKSRLSYYKKLLRKKGLKKSVKIKGV